MNREQLPCNDCAKFVPAKAGTGDCTDHDRPANADDPPCVLFLARGSKAARMAGRTDEELREEIARKQHRNENIPRASAPTAAPTREKK